MLLLMLLHTNFCKAGEILLPKLPEFFCNKHNIDDYDIDSKATG